MRDDFYYWLFMALLGALFLGAAIVGGESGLLAKWQQLSGAGLVLVVSVAGTISHYRIAQKGRCNGI